MENIMHTTSLQNSRSLQLLRLGRQYRNKGQSLLLYSQNQGTKQCVELLTQLSDDKTPNGERWCHEATKRVSDIDWILMNCANAKAQSLVRATASGKKGK